MPLRRMEPPPGTTDVVMSRLGSMAANPPYDLRAFGGSDPAGLRPEDPHEVYTLGLDDILSGRGLGAARLSGWRYFLSDGSRIVSTAETVATSDGQQRFAQFNSGPFVGATVEALEAARSLPQVRDRDVEARVLRVPGLNLVALWLRDGGDDVLIPLAPAPPDVDAGRRYTPRELFDALRAQALEHASIRPGDTRGA